jgi:two-component system LytT family response regulator
MVTALIVDDDLLSITFLESIIKINFSNQIKIVGTATNAPDAKGKIEDFQPDVVFLDIQLPEVNGFEFISELKSIDFDIIVTTVSPEYAANAFKINAIDFLVKPIQIPDLSRAIQKVTQKIFLEDNKLPKIGNHKIGLPTNRGVIFINPSTIIYCQADNNYTDIHFEDGGSENISRTLKEVEIVLRDLNFLRIHKSFLINFEKISQYIKSDGGHLIMEGSKEMLPISKNAKEELLRNLKIL